MSLQKPRRAPPSVARVTEVGARREMDGLGAIQGAALRSPSGPQRRTKERNPPKGAFEHVSK